MSYRQGKTEEKPLKKDIIEAGPRGFRMGPILVLCVLVIMAMTSSLVYFRVYGLSLDSMLDFLAGQKMSLERSLSEIEKITLALGSPSAVYGYAFENLGMTQGAIAGTVRIRYSNGGVASVVPEGTVERWSGSLPPLKKDVVGDSSFVKH